MAYTVLNVYTFWFVSVSRQVLGDREFEVITEDEGERTVMTQTPQWMLKQAGGRGRGGRGRGRGTYNYYNY